MHSSHAFRFFINLIVSIQFIRDLFGVGLIRFRGILRFQIQIKEEERLACVIQMIDCEAAIVPRGAYKLTPDGNVSLNDNYKG